MKTSDKPGATRVERRNMDEIKLKPCPFCGEVPIPIGHGMSSGDSIFWVRCYGCGASTTLFNSEEAAKKAWNRRADNVGR